MKDHVRSLAEDEYGHLALVAALSTVDDTTLLRKSIGGPLQSMMGDALRHKYARRVLLHLLAPFNNRYLPAEYHDWVRPAPVSESEARGGEDGEAGDEGDEDGAGGASSGRGVSRKDPDLRRREVLGSGPGSLSESVVAAVEADAGALIRDFHGADCLVEVARGGEGATLAEVCSEGVERAQDMIVQMAAAARDHGDDDAGGEEHVLLNYVANRALRRLLILGRTDETVRRFAQKLWDGALKGRCKEWFGSHADKVLAAVLSCGDVAVEKAATEELQPLVAKQGGAGGLQEWAVSHGLAKASKKK
uniref:Pumilio homology domain family member 6 n=1 Tax=Tetraselmis sp. GSL018 TaxID=582737 RepID=A0A061SK00_9CHLO